MKLCSELSLVSMNDDNMTGLKPYHVSNLMTEPEGNDAVDEMLEF